MSSPSLFALPLAAMLAIAGVLALRLGWGRRQPTPSVAGWAMLAGAVWAGAAAGGAWGITVASLWAMVTALALVGLAAWQAPAPVRSPRLSRVATPPARQPSRIGGRLATFAIVAIGGLVAATGLALAVHWLATLAGAGEANANVALLFTLPLAWAVLAHLLMTASRRSQGVTLVACLAAAIPALL
ncbi:hypothetical protein PK98_13535 [Croceibacterium mercuriale]|uniref:Uncharacterized protein n=1 Tax=Croceibacterium mercuriale TaxID=1572751 RepID=A0A0B2BTX5_9SPHN|nr:hypothetical protein [Croceibacterium mercuriale]KHL24889.1 hypothetical protein PK98_13535 [Croceibacterium mercuriale]